MANTTKQDTLKRPAHSWSLNREEACVRDSRQSVLETSELRRLIQIETALAEYTDPYWRVHIPVTIDFLSMLPTNRIPS